MPTHLSSPTIVVPLPLDPAVLTVVKNAYGDLQTTQPTEFSSSLEAFDEQLTGLLTRPDAVRGIWMRLPWALYSLVPVAAARGFKPHHWCVASNSLILQWWSPTAGENPTPLHSHVDVGCGALVINSRGELLAVRERFGTGAWNPPGGHLDIGEDMLTCAVREAREETGVIAVALGAVGLHEFDYDALPPPIDADDATIARIEHAARWGATHHGMWVLCYALNDRLSPDTTEVLEARWLQKEEWSGAFSAPINALVEAAYASGQFTVAANSSAQSAPSSLHNKQQQQQQQQCTTSMSPLITATKGLLPGRRGPRSHTLYTALPNTVVEAAFKVAGGQSVIPLTQHINTSTTTPTTTTNCNRKGMGGPGGSARMLAITSIAVGIGFIIGARWGAA
jgi:8-oxo-dGTP pyrophosphatase MutT (NUDIX family)